MDITGAFTGCARCAKRVKRGAHRGKDGCIGMAKVMKKRIAVMITALMIALCGMAAAEGTLDNGTWVRFEEGFEICLPADWYQIEASESMAQAGVFYCAASPDGKDTVQIAWEALDEQKDIEAVKAELQTVYPNAALCVINGVAGVRFTDTKNKLSGIAMLDAVKPGVYTFWFTPVFDAKLEETPAQIAATIRNTQP